MGTTFFTWSSHNKESKKGEKTEGRKYESSQTPDVYIKDVGQF